MRRDSRFASRFCSICRAFHGPIVDSLPMSKFRSSHTLRISELKQSSSLLWKSSIVGTALLDMLVQNGSQLSRFKSTSTTSTIVRSSSIEVTHLWLISASELGLQMPLASGAPDSKSLNSEPLKKAIFRPNGTTRSSTESKWSEIILLLVIRVIFPFYDE